MHILSTSFECLVYDGAMELVDEIRMRRKRRGWSQTDLGIAAKVSHSTIQSLEAGKKISQKNYLRVLAALQIDAPENVTPAPMPVYNLAVAAGELVYVDEDGPDHRMGSEIANTGIFGVYVSGDSMEPDYPNGSLVIFKVLRIDDNGLLRGKDYYIHLSDGRATFKRFVAANDDSLAFGAINKRKYPRQIIVPRQMLARVALALRCIPAAELEVS
jgi:transcriptional regulator with XRE-family HTH domain